MRIDARALMGAVRTLCAAPNAGTWAEQRGLRAWIIDVPAIGKDVRRRPRTAAPGPERLECETSRCFEAARQLEVRWERDVPRDVILALHRDRGRAVVATARSIDDHPGVRPDANAIALRVLRSILAAAHPVQLRVAGIEVTCSITRHKGEWPEGVVGLPVSVKIDAARICE